MHECPRGGPALRCLHEGGSERLQEAVENLLDDLLTGAHALDLVDGELLQMGMSCTSEAESCSWAELGCGSCRFSAIRCAGLTLSVSLYDVIDGAS